jgi:hypothetical protein
VFHSTNCLGRADAIGYQNARFRLAGHELAKGLERRTYLRREQLRLLPRREVAAPLGFVEVDQAWESAAGPRRSNTAPTTCNRPFGASKPNRSLRRSPNEKSAGPYRLLLIVQVFVLKTCGF